MASSPVFMLTSFLTPPMAPSIFYLRGISPPEIRLRDMYRGVLSFRSSPRFW